MMDEINEAVGIRIKKLLDSRGVSQTVLAKAVHVSKDMVSKVITGKAKLSIHTAIRIADYFETSLDYLYGRTCFVNIPQYMRDIICSHIMPRNIKVNDKPIPSLSVSQSLSDYFESVFEISRINDAILPDDMRSELFSRKEQELLDAFQNRTVGMLIDYHLVRGELKDVEVEKEIQELKPSNK